MRPALTITFAAIAGAIHAASFSGPFAWLQVAAMASLLVLLPSPHGRSAHRLRLLATFLFGVGWFTAGVGWVYVSMHDVGGMPAPVAALAVLLFASYLSSFFVIAVALADAIVLRMRPSDGMTTVASLAAPGFVFAACWGLAEWARGTLFTGFPWLAIGYAHPDGPLSPLAPVVGVHALSACAALVAYAIALPFAADDSRRGLRAAVLLIAPLALAGGLSAGREWTVPHGDPLTVRLAQGNVPQAMKFDPARAVAAMRAYVDLAGAAPAQLAVLPETAWVVGWQRTPPDVAARMAALVARMPVAVGMPLAVQTPAGDPRPQSITNSVALLAPVPGSSPAAPEARIASRYDKRHLVPFGEFIPFGFAWFVRMMNIPMGEFARGAPSQPPFEINGQRLAFNVCYEDLFGEELIGAIRGERGANVMVNATNIGWFGRSHALSQHLQIARMRSLETGRPTIRATNSGVTASIDARGRVLASLPPHTVGVLQVTVQGTIGDTPYVRFGPTATAATFAVLAMLAAVAAIAGRMRRR